MQESEIIEENKVLTRFIDIRQRTEKICSYLEKEDFVVQPIVDVSPPKWHLAHTSWFFETFLLKKYLNAYKEYNPNFGFLFNSYYESIGARTLRTHRGNLTRPTVDEVLAYRAYVNENMGILLQKSGEVDEEAFHTFLEIGLQHEQQHQELLMTDIKYILGHNPLFPPYRTLNVDFTHSEKSKEMVFKEIISGLYSIGAHIADFAWDNEKPQHTVYLKEYKMADRLVTNAEYLEFMQDGGYKNFSYWLSEGWDFINKEKISAPLYWHQIDGEWYYFTLNGLQKMDENAAVCHISFYEADAFATWKGKRLPTEQEWEVFAQQNQQEAANANFYEKELWQPTSAMEGNLQLAGDCWEWTYSSYQPYPGYNKAEGALGEYNGKFMINQMVLRGGSCVTPENHFRTTYRNFFHADKRWQFSGLRLAE